MYAAATMYLEHFGLREFPFSLAPDPRYLYLSGQHREALAHLLYGVQSEGGFVQLTGEVGTGKTTVCRCFLEQLPQGTRAAVILNPCLGAEELLAAICDEFAVERPPGPASLKESLDRVNRFLLEVHAAGGRAVLVVDEAQNLGPAVLEQVRLLTNLETSRHKLLQVILMGQPELRETLARPELRQLAQRVTARFHLRPLSREETRAYVRHRLGVAGCHEELFPGRVIPGLVRLSRGVPRLINILCDRALLGAFVQGRHRVDAATLGQAAREVAGEPVAGGQRWRRPTLTAAVLAGALLAAARAQRAALPPAVRAPARAAAPAAEIASTPTPAPAAAVAPLPAAAPAPLSAPTPPRSPAPAPAPEPASVPPAPPATALSAGSGGAVKAIVAEPRSPRSAAAAPAAVLLAAVPETAVPVAAGSVAPRAPAAPPRSPLVTAVAAAPETAVGRAPGPPAPPAGVLHALLEEPGAQDEDEAWRQLYGLWGRTPREGENGCGQALSHGLHCLRGDGGIEGLRGQNRPAILRMRGPSGAPRWLVLERLQGRQATLVAGGARTAVDVDRLAGYGIRDYALLWRPPAGTRGGLAEGDRGPGVAWLARRLAHEAGPGAEAVAAEVYDAALSERVRVFQRARGLEADGTAGPAVLLALDAEPEPGTPTLRADAGR